MKKIFIGSFTIVISLIVVKAVLIANMLLLEFPILKNLPNAINVLIFIVGLSIGIFFGILTFRKLFRYLMKEIIT